jgi:hypothetical protein
MKMRTIKLTSKTLIETLKGKTVVFDSDLSSDLELLDIKFDLPSNQVILIVRSDSFEDIPEEYPIPELNLSNTENLKAATSLKIVAPKIVSQLTSTKKSETQPATKKPQPQTNQYANKMAEEFSPEQRKLLSFTVSEESVIVKPIQFLKAEWDDINETVRSLGGKWVKGDIVSYWTIPLQ